MKVLCLHGYGTNASILETQLSTYRSSGDENIEFVFIDGEEPAKRAPGVGTFVPGPFLCYSSNFSPRDMKNCHELISEVIEEQGPFGEPHSFIFHLEISSCHSSLTVLTDGVLGFSQGGSLALSYLLQHEVQNPGSPPPFHFAVLFSTVVAFSPDESFGQDVIESFTSEQRTELRAFPKSDFSIFGGRSRAFVESIAKAFGSAKSGGFIAAGTGEDFFHGGNTSAIPRVMHPQLIKQRIRVPTVHVVGKKDSREMVELSRLMQDICDKSLVRSLEHTGGHDVSRRPADAKEAMAATVWAIQESQRFGW